ncbi:MAG: hypothetical protein LEGION0398_MBIBDBAK_00540 [Legionellaceae bacterium]
MSNHSCKQKDREVISTVIDLLVEKGVDLTSVLKEEGILKKFSKRLVERVLQSEMDNY